MEQNKERNKGGRPKKEATEKLKYRVAVKMATPQSQLPVFRSVHPYIE